MPKFEKKYVHFMWSDELEGKMVFFADYIPQLKQRVENNIVGHYAKVTKGEANLPFRIVDGQASWQFAYYDPYYALKVAREQGKVVQRYWKSEQEWEEHIGDDFTDDISLYRIKPDEPEESKPVTNRELARWLAQGNGEYYEYDCDGWESHRCIEYQYEQDNLPVSKVMVRKWEDEEWHNPTREYLGLE